MPGEPPSTDHEATGSTWHLTWRILVVGLLAFTGGFVGGLLRDPVVLVDGEEWFCAETIGEPALPDSVVQQCDEFHDEQRAQALNSGAAASVLAMGAAWIVFRTAHRRRA